MIASFSYIVLPLLACFLLVSIYVYLGHHVLRRGVIFVDIAIAQIAVLGLTFAFYLGFEPKSHEAYLYALVFSIAGAALFAFAKPKGASQYLARSQKKVLALGKLLGSLALFALILYGIPRGAHLLGLKKTHHHHPGEEDHQDHETKGSKTAVIPKKESEFSKILKDLQNLDPFAGHDEMEKLCHRWGQENILKSLSKLLEAAKTQKDENLKLNIPKLLLHYQNKGGGGLLIEVLEKSEGAMVREEALRVLKKAAGQDFGYDPFMGAEENKEALKKWKEWWKKNLERKGD